jgi:RHS repeat-associated protein
VVKYAYDSFGNCKVLLDTAGLSTVNPIRYRGYYYDHETGLYYLNARYYNPEWRRFISPDSTAYIDPDVPNGLNLYAYCGNDPVNYADPSGRFAISAFFGIYALIAITATSMLIGGSAQIVSNAISGEKGSNLWRGVAGAAFGTGVDALVLCLTMEMGIASLFIAAGASAVVQSGIDVVESLIFEETITINNIVESLLWNFGATLSGNYLGGELIPINTNWIKTQKFWSVFTKPYGQKILKQSMVGAAVSGTVNVYRKKPKDNKPFIIGPAMPTLPFVWRK